MTALQATWFFLVGILLTGYAVLDGFDLGVGFWHLFTRGDDERRRLLASIAPVWDGNEVWLVAGAGALFAAFPPVYAAVLSGLYPAVMALLAALIFREVAIEFRGHGDSARWRRSWDAAFAAGSALATLLFGLAVGNLLRGLPLDAAGNYAGNPLDLVNPFAVLVGLLALAMFAAHGALYIVLKTDGPLAARAARWARAAGWVYAGLFVATMVAAPLVRAGLARNFRDLPVLWLVPGAALAAMGLVGVFIRRAAPRKAFLASALSIVLVSGTWGAAMFPTLVPALGAPEHSLTAANASSSPLTLKIMLVAALVGLPIVLAYTAWVYRTFRGKVSLGNESY